MLLFEIVSIDPVEPMEKAHYSSLSRDGESLLLLDGPGKRIARHSACLQYVEHSDISRAYNGICYDPVERCYWCCCNQNSDAVYKLTPTFQEMDRHLCGSYQKEHGTVHSIAYDKERDCLILTYSNRVVSVDKHTFCEKEIRACGCGFTYHGAIRSCGCDCILARRCNAECLLIAREGHTLVHACLPTGYRAAGITENCEDGRQTVRILAHKNGAYHYLLKGVLVEHMYNPHARVRCHDEQQREDACDCLCGETTHPHTGGRCDESIYCHHTLDHHCLTPAITGLTLEGSCAALIQSVALEQTAISHILNAEGEKIQKVVAVSDQPADFLGVNQSVLEMVNKLTHLEQVLYSKLELACGVLRREPIQ